MNELTKRILVAIIGIPIGLFLMLEGGVYLLVAILIITHLAYMELANIFAAKEIYINKFILSFISYFVFIIIYKFQTSINLYPILTMTISGGFLLLFLFSLWDKKGESVKNLIAAVFSLLYISIGFGAVLFVRQHTELNTNLINNLGTNKYFLISIVSSIWVCDSAAYFFGRAFGRHKLFPRHSPKKSIEGAIAGLIFTFLSLYFFFHFYGVAGKAEIDFLLYATFCVGVLGQLGDLAESQLKRWSGVKDSSNIIPGHGGILDRFDSVLFVFPAIAVYLVYLSII